MFFSVGSDSVRLSVQHLFFFHTHPLAVAPIFSVNLKLPSFQIFNFFYRKRFLLENVLRAVPPAYSWIDFVFPGFHLLSSSAFIIFTAVSGRRHSGHQPRACVCVCWSSFLSEIAHIFFNIWLRIQISRPTLSLSLNFQNRFLLSTVFAFSFRKKFFFANVADVDCVLLPFVLVFFFGWKFVVCLFYFSNSFVYLMVGCWFSNVFFSVRSVCNVHKSERMCLRMCAYACVCECVCVW